MNRFFFQQIVILTLTFFVCGAIFADPRPPGKIVFLGTTANNQMTVWLSVTDTGEFQVEARNQVVDLWTQPQPGLHVTFSPFVSNGSGDPHSLFQIINGELVFIDNDNQQGGITFPPLPGGLPPGQVTPPIALPGVPSHPIVVPEPITPPTNPITPPTGSIDSGTASVRGGRNANTPQRNAGRNAPLTRGREFLREPLFNFWVDGRYFGVTDHRYLLDRSGNASVLTLGADRRIDPNLAIGAMFGVFSGQSSAFNQNWTTKANGFTVGPYLGYRFLPNWAINLNLNYGSTENHNNIVMLNSRYRTSIYSASLLGTGVYNLCFIQLRAKPAIFYSYFTNPSYNLVSSRNNSLTVPISANNFSFGLSQLGFEFSKTMMLANDSVTLVPYIEPGVNYIFVSPNNGKILTRYLTMQNTTPWSGYTRLGCRASIGSSFFLEATGSYLSIGQKNLDIFEARLFLSWAIY